MSLLSPYITRSDYGTTFASPLVPALIQERLLMDDMVEMGDRHKTSVEHARVTMLPYGQGDERDQRGKTLSEGCRSTRVCSMPPVEEEIGRRGSLGQGTTPGECVVPHLPRERAAHQQVLHRLRGLIAEQTVGGGEDHAKPSEQLSSIDPTAQARQKI